MLEGKYECLKLDNQLCFPLYACSKEVVRKYKPFLDKINLTYTQYIAMMVLWEHEEISVKRMGEYLYLDSGTLTPLLKTLEKKGFVERKRSSVDERSLNVTLTKDGEALKEKAFTIPSQIGQCLALNREDAKELYRILHRLMDQM
ncbi:MAG: MarR family transcriptional regulator [Lachnospiraceae bacterium]|nr:MarR family transcriptional regulator [Lachnospiraceae bacterium]